MITLNASSGLIGFELSTVRLAGNKELIDQIALAASSELARSAADGHLDNALVEEVMATAEWYAVRKLFDQAEELFMTVLEAQESVLGSDHIACNDTLGKMLALLIDEQKLQAEETTYDLSESVLMFAAAG